MAEKFGYKEGDFPVTESVAERTIALPFYNNLSKDDIALVCKTLKEALD
jgi:perosamine synthetase